MRSIWFSRGATMLKLLDIRSACLALALAALIASTPTTPDSAPTERLTAAEVRPTASTQFFPMGWFDNLDDPGRLAAMRSYGLNAVLPYNGQRQASLRTYLDEARRRGLKVFVEVDRVAVASGNATLVRAFVEVYRSHPAVGGWLLADEPTIDPQFKAVTPAVAKAQYKQIKAADPSRPVAIVFGTYENPRPYVSAMDVLMYDDYVQNHGTKEFVNLWIWRQRLEDRGKIAAKLDGYIPVLQGFGQDARGRPQETKRLPTTKELRYMTFGALQHKATGIFLWARFRSRTDWISKVLSPLSKEVAPALAAFGAGAASGSSAGSGKTRTALFRDPKSGTRYLVVVNHGAVATKAHVKVTTSLKMKKAYSKTDGSWDISDGGFERTFGPYEAQMYRLSG